MAGSEYNKRKREAVSERNRLRAIRSNEAQAERRKQNATQLHVVGGFHTYGSMGYHHIELLDCGHETHLWVAVDGRLRTPRTDSGFRRIMCDWMLNGTHEIKAPWCYCI